MRQVRVNFNLVGNTSQFTRLLKDFDKELITNDTILDQIKEQVAYHFGDRAIMVHNEDSLMYGSYPEYYAATWFVSEETGVHGTDLIVVAHGDNMQDAQNTVLNAVRMADWESLASRY